MSVQDLIAAAFNKDAVTFEETLKGLLDDRMDDAVEQYAESITFEEVDQIDEISQETLDSYKEKALKQYAKANRNKERAVSRETKQRHADTATKRSKGIGSVQKREFARGDTKIYKGGAWGMTDKTPEQMSHLAKEE